MSGGDLGSSSHDVRKWIPVPEVLADGILGGLTGSELRNVHPGFRGPGSSVVILPIASGSPWKVRVVPIEPVLWGNGTGQPGVHHGHLSGGIGGSSGPVLWPWTAEINAPVRQLRIAGDAAVDGGVDPAT